MDYRPISADSHMDMGYIPADTFTARAPAEWRDRMPRVVEGGPNGPVWVAGKDGEYKMGAWGIHGQPGLSIALGCSWLPVALCHDRRPWESYWLRCLEDTNAPLASGMYLPKFATDIGP
mgnify:CR=1 FL=1